MKPTITTQQDLINRVNRNIQKARELQENSSKTNDKSLLIERKIDNLIASTRNKNNERLQKIQESINRSNARINIALNEAHNSLSDAKQKADNITNNINANVEKNSSGTYVAVNYTDVSNKELDRIIKDLGLEKDFTDSYHTTIAYSKKQFTFFPYTCGSRRRKSKFVPGNMNKVKIRNISHFDTPEGKNLHIVLDAPFCVMEHKRTLRAGAQYDHKEYIPHITLMYNCKDFDIVEFRKNNAQKFNDIIGRTLVLKDEYVEKLDLDWAEKVQD